MVCAAQKLAKNATYHKTYDKIAKDGPNETAIGLCPVAVFHFQYVLLIRSH